MASADFELALAHYRMLFADLAALGTAGATWRVEYDRVAATGLSATLITTLSHEGGSSGAARNFEQTVLLRALLARRAELDSVFAATVFAPTTARRNLGIRVRLE